MQGFLSLTLSFQLPGVQAPGLIVGCIEIQNFLAGSQGVIRSVESQVERYECFSHLGRLGLALPGALKRSDCVLQAIGVLIEQSDAIQPVGLAPVKFVP
jgi:hypothetical protein